ncbi:hypothetical protein LP43_1418 [Methylophaga thiooxydans]|uniref:Uncharacterized protein n=1 Tax=Methylophaga thiooxydans TaxID=392484 RepID=A0A0A0BEG0_9GAMM|nr:hypothetical protein [Methylophaga thiooxydans]KGM06923.1 hypothetical protein LP43_1418 [Methylophaga thiooxydans]
MSNYIPKIQHKRGQLFDSLFVLVLVYVSLYIPLFLESDTKSVDETVLTQAHTWESLDVSTVEQEQWQKLGFDETAAAEIINDKFDYTINPVMLVITALVIIGYFFFVLRVSQRQYREVIDEKFGHGDTQLNEEATR